MLRTRSFIATLLFATALCISGLQSVSSQSGALRRITNTTEEGKSLNPTLSGDGRRIAFESTEDVATAGGAQSFRAIRADVMTDPAAFTQMGATRAPAPAISQDGARIAFAAKEDPLGTNPDGNSEIFFYDGVSLRQITNTSPASLAQRTRDGNFLPSISDDGRLIAFSSNRELAGLNADANFEIFIYNTTTQTFAQLTDTSGTFGATDAKISGDGSRVAYIRDNGNTVSAQRDLVLLNRADATTNARTIANSISGLAMTFGRAISDDGSRIVYSADTATNASQVFLFDGRNNNNSTRQITALAAREDDVPLHPTISGDGSRLAFATRRNVSGGNSDNSIELYTYDVPTGQIARVTNAPSSASGFDGKLRLTEVVSSLNDDGSLIAFNFPRSLSGPVSSNDVANNSEIYITATAARPQFGSLNILNGASFGHEPSTTEAVAPDSIAVALGGALANSTLQSARLSDGTFPRTVGGTTVTVNGRAAQIFFVSPAQVNFLVPAETETGAAEVVITNSEGFQSRGTITILKAAPGVFTFNGDGTGEGVILDADTLQRSPFDPSNGQRRLIVFATGVRNAAQVSVTIAGRAVAFESVKASPDMPGMDEIRILLPADLRGAGTVDLIVRADGRDSNPVTIMLTGDAMRDIVINEILADPPDGLAGDANRDGTRSATQDEFVELVNNTARDIDISGFQLLTRGTSGSDAVRHTFAPGTIFAPGTAIVIFGGGTLNANDPAFGGALVLTASTNGLSLINAGGVVTLRDAAGAFIQQVSYGGSTGLDADANQSLTRSPDITGAFTLHQSAAGSSNRLFSPGTRVDSTPFGSAATTIARIEVAPANASIAIGAQQQFTARAFNASGQEITGVIFFWQSSAPGIATIDQNGLATGVAAGTAAIRASARGVQSAPATLTIVQQQRILTRIEVVPQTASIPPGGAQQFTARAFDQNNQEITNVTFTFASSDPNVATVDQTGLATGVAVGVATITASAQNVIGMATLNVAAPVVVINEVLADPPGSALTDLIGDANRDNARSASDDEFVELVNSSNAIVDISGWKILTRATGSTTETARHTFTNGTTLLSTSAIVVFGGGAFDPNNTAFGCAQVVKASTGGLSLTNSGLTVVVRDASNNLVAQFTYGGATGLNGDNDQSLTRSPDITGNFVRHSMAANSGARLFSPGTHVDGTPFGQCAGRLATFTITPATASVTVGQTMQFTAQAFDQFGRSLSGMTISFASSNTTVATVDSVTTNAANGSAIASVTGRNAGTTEIRASATDGANTVTSNPAVLTVTAAQPRITRITVAPATAAINRGATQQFTATAFDENNQVVSGITFTWTSSNTAVATVDANGLARGIGIGTTTITATAPDGASGTVSGQATLNVLVSLVINEILADPPDGLAGDANRDGTRDGTQDEFVELFNDSNAPVDISGVIIADATSNRFTFPANTTLAAGQAAVVFGGGAPSPTNPAFGGALVFTSSGLSLNNAGDTVTVELPLAGTDVVIAAQTFGAEGDTNQSLTRSPDAEIGTTGGAFVGHTMVASGAGRAFSPGTRTDGTPFGSPVITRIAITPATASIAIGETQTFIARAFSNTSGTEVEVSNVSFIWDSSDTSKATVSPITGASTTATGIAAGTVTIRARAGGQQGTASLTINPPPSVLTRIDVMPASATITVGGTQQFTARAFDQNNQEITGATFTWASSNSNVATINQNGLATGVNPGTTQITASSGNVTSNPATLTVTAAGGAAIPSAGQVVINEALVSFAASTATPPQPRPDFVELFNKTNQALDISGLVITFRSSGNTMASATLPGAVGSGTTVIAPNGYFLIVNGTDSFGVAADFNASTLGFDLNATAGGIKIEIGGVKLDGLAYKESTTTTLPAPFDTFGEGAVFVLGSTSGNKDLIRSPNGADTNDNATDFRRNGTATSVTPKAANPAIP